MTAPLPLTHRFDLLIAGTPSALPTTLSVIEQFAVTPVAVTTRRHMQSLQSVTIVLRHLAEGDARAIAKRLRQIGVVRCISLEHMI